MSDIDPRDCADGLADTEQNMIEALRKQLAMYHLRDKVWSEAVKYRDEQIAKAEALRVCADHDANELARQLTEYQARDKVRIRYLELIANVNAMDYEYKSWARAALDIPAEKFK